MADAIIEKEDIQNERGVSNGSNQTTVTEHLIRIPEQTFKEEGLKCRCTRQTTVMLACFANHIIVVGFTSALGVIYVELIRSFDSFRSEAALVQSLYLGITVSGGIIFSNLVYKYGPGICVALGMIFSSLSVFISSFSLNIYMMIVFVGAFCAVGTSITFMCDFITVSWAFQTNKRSALAFLTISSTVGQVSFPYLAEVMLEIYFWSGTMMLFSGVLLHVLPTGLLIHFSRHILEYEATTESSTNILKCASIFKKCNMLFVCFVIFVIDLGAGIASYFSVDLSEMRGFEREVGASFLSILGFSGLAGRVSGTVLLSVFKNISATTHYVHSLALYGIAHFLVIYFKDYLGMLIGIILQGFSNGLTVSIFPGFLIEQFGADKFPIAIASTNVISGLFDIVIGFFGGFVADLTGGYALIYIIAIITSGLGSGITFYCAVVQGSKEPHTTKADRL